ncbi:MAG: KGG domain-containing protein [Pseudomonadota bacterium]
MAKAKAPREAKPQKGAMTVAEAGRKGGLTVRDERGHEFYEEIGRKGGHKVRDLIAAGKRALEQRGGR